MVIGRIAMAMIMLAMKKTMATMVMISIMMLKEEKTAVGSFL